MKEKLVGPLLAAFVGAAIASNHAAETQTMNLHVLMRFDEHGAAQSVQLLGNQGLSDSFQDQLRQRLLAVRVPPQRWADQPASLHTGAVVRLQLPPEGQAGSVRLEDLRFTPLPIERGMQELPKELALLNEFDYEFEVRCEIDAKGICSQAELLGRQPLPEPVRRWALGSTRGWRFIPQRLGSQALPGTVWMPIRLRSQYRAGDERPLDFRTLDTFSRMPSARP